MCWKHVCRGRRQAQRATNLVFRSRAQERSGADEAPASERGLLAGMPVPIKDLMDVVGVRNTYGSRIFADNVLSLSDILVVRLEENGPVIC